MAAGEREEPAESEGGVRRASAWGAAAGEVAGVVVDDGVEERGREPRGLHAVPLDGAREAAAGGA